MSRGRIIFAGTPQFSVSCLDALFQRPVDIVAVYCQPDRPAGRGRKLRPCPVKQHARSLGLQVMQPATLKSDEAIDQFRRLNADLMVVVAYGLILPAEILDSPRLGCVNVHASLLPRWRGAAPIQRAIEAGDDSTGITLMQMDPGLDTGPMLARVETTIDPRETGGSLHDRLADLGARLLVEQLEALLAGACEPQLQDDAQATYAAKITREDAGINWREDARTIALRVRAFDPWPACWTRLDTLELKILGARQLDDTKPESPPGTVVASNRDGIDVACGRGLLRILELRKAGGRRLTAGEFLNGFSIACGEKLGPL